MLLNRFRILTPFVLTFQCGDLYIITQFRPYCFKAMLAMAILEHISLGMRPVLVSDQ